MLPSVDLGELIEFENYQKAVGKMDKNWENEKIPIWLKISNL